MILRYYETDWSVPCIENELLFVGTKEECYNYLFKNWSVDCQELKDNIELQAIFQDYLRHIEFSNKHFEETNVNAILENHPDWDNAEWHKIDSTKFIYNRELVEEIIDDIDVSYFEILALMSL